MGCVWLLWQRFAAVHNLFTPWRCPAIVIDGRSSIPIEGPSLSLSHSFVSAFVFISALLFICSLCGCLSGGVWGRLGGVPDVWQLLWGPETLDGVKGRGLGLHPSLSFSFFPFSTYLHLLEFFLLSQSLHQLGFPLPVSSDAPARILPYRYANDTYVL